MNPKHERKQGKTASKKSEGWRVCCNAERPEVYHCVLCIVLSFWLVFDLQSSS